MKSTNLELQDWLDREALEQAERNIRIRRLKADKKADAFGEALQAVEQGLKYYFDDGTGNYVSKDDTRAGDQRGGIYNHGKWSDGYNFIPLGVTRLYPVLQKIRANFAKAYPASYPTFIDVGCGPGVTLAMAQALKFNAYGIEYNPKTAALASKIFSYRDRDRIMNMDAFEYKEYGKFDVLYFYCPIANHELEKKLEKMLRDEMKPGAWIVPRNSMYEWNHDLHFQPYGDYDSGNYYQKLPKKREMTEWEVQEAERRKRKCKECGQLVDECTCDDEDDEGYEEDDGDDGGEE